MSALFSPLTIRDVTFPNRLWVAPMCQYSIEAQDGVPGDWHLAHLAAFATGGAGLVVVEATGVVPEGRISPQDVGLWNDEQRDAFARIVGFLHAQGALAGVQLAHAGRKASTYRPWSAERGSVPVEQGGWPTVAPSAKAFGRYAEPTELSTEDVRALVVAFATAARRAVDAGFDVIELHGAHGYLIHEFLSPLSNERTDEHGGSLEGRARFLLEIVRAVRAEVGASVPVFVRLSASDWAPGGFEQEDAATVAGWARDAGADLFDISTGGLVPHQDIDVRPLYQVPHARFVRESAGGPVSASPRARSTRSRWHGSSSASPASRCAPRTSSAPTSPGRCSTSAPAGRGRRPRRAPEHGPRLSRCCEVCDPRRRRPATG